VAEKVGKKVEETINVLLFWVERREKEGRTIVAPATPRWSITLWSVLRYLEPEPR
jgi:hypothetical protein